MADEKKWETRAKEKGAFDIVAETSFVFLSQ